MGESFYTVLGVDQGADARAVDRAYRGLAKSQHPDNNDDPDACRQFKRLTVARDTLVDDDERASYDRLGHEEYVCQNGYDGLFETTAASGGGSSDQMVRTDGSGTDDDWWTDRSADATHGASAAPTGDDSIYGGQSSDSTGGQPTEPTGPIRSAVGVVRRLGAWTALHLVLFVSVGITGWFLLAGSASLAVSGPVAVLFGLIALAAVSASVVHIALQVYV